MGASTEDGHLSAVPAATAPLTSLEHSDHGAKLCGFDYRLGSL
ncbi:hypothetical protein [Streptomyces sp. NPDC086835]